MIIFLDIDGVMVPAKNWKSPELLDDGFPSFSMKATNVLKKIVSKKDTVMLTTSHKGNYSIQEWKNIFHKRGIDVFRLSKLPENRNFLSRKEELLHWFELHDIKEDFVIFDDDKSLFDLPPNLKTHLVSTNPMIGLTEEHLSFVQQLGYHV